MVLVCHVINGNVVVEMFSVVKEQDFTCSHLNIPLLLISV